MIALRYRALREPLGIEYHAAYSPQQLAAEANDVLIAGYTNERIIGCLILTPLNGQTAQMRQVAVEEIWQGQGVGRQLIAFAEQAARERGFAEITLHGRESAFPFYERLGYAAFGPTFSEVGLPHREMRKFLE